jgi:hypothetical protein
MVFWKQAMFCFRRGNDHALSESGEVCVALNTGETGYVQRNEIVSPLSGFFFEKRPEMQGRGGMLLQVHMERNGCPFQ